MNFDLPPLEDFILPGGSRAAAACHLARAISRRAERNAWSLSRVSSLNPDLLRYLNRLSDFLFVAARLLTVTNGGSETLWRRQAPPQN
jgi:cob(I)alamin adenosyltransferase